MVVGIAVDATKIILLIWIKENEQIKLITNIQFVFRL